MKTKLKNGTKVEIFEESIRGMAGEPMDILKMKSEDGEIQCVNNNCLHLFNQEDREEIVEWLDYLNEGNRASAIAWSI